MATISLTIRAPTALVTRASLPRIPTRPCGVTRFRLARHAEMSLGSRTVIPSSSPRTLAVIRGRQGRRTLVQGSSAQQTFQGQIWGHLLMEIRMEQSVVPEARVQGMLKLIRAIPQVNTRKCVSPQCREKQPEEDRLFLTSPRLTSWP